MNIVGEGLRPLRLVSASTSRVFFPDNLLRRKSFENTLFSKVEGFDSESQPPPYETSRGGWSWGRGITGESGPSGSDGRKVDVTLRRS